MRHLKARRIGAVLCLGLGMLQAVVLVRDASAGSGTLTVEARDPFDQTITTRAGLELSVFLDVPRTAAELDDFEEQMMLANRILCDASDGLFHINKVTYLNDPKQRGLADIWWYRAEDRSSSWGPFGVGGPSGPNCSGDGSVTNGDQTGRFVIYSSVGSDGDRISENGMTLAHELGHLLFGAQDEYPDTRAGDRVYPHGSAINGPLSVTDPYTGKEFFRSVNNGFETRYVPTGLLFQEPMKPDPSNPGAFV